MESMSVSDDGGSPPRRKTPITARRKKSAAQVEFLERMYAENKYPSEEVRAKLSAQLGLSEKQMQIWFTHRRHKDRKDGVEDVKLTFYAMRHKGGEAHLDFMEELNNGKRPNFLERGDTPPSGSYPPNSYSGGEVSSGQTDRRTDSESENSGLNYGDLVHRNGMKASAKRGIVNGRKDGVHKRPTMIPPVAKLQARDVEIAAISAVEMQLGETIRMDGPHLGLEFDSPPADAWARLSHAAAVPVTLQERDPMAALHGRVGRVQSVGYY